MAKAINMEGERIGRLLVIERSTNANNRVMWKCKCDCGNVKDVLAKSLRRGATQSCGCLHTEIRKKWASTLNLTHGMKGTPEYTSYISAKNRCTNHKHEHYPNYGGRGILFKFSSFEEFFREIGYKPSLTHTVDRIDNNGHYEPGNVKWSTPKQQGTNRRNNVFYEFNGEKMTAPEWAEKLGIRRRTIAERVRRGWTIDEALGTSVNSGKGKKRA